MVEVHILDEDAGHKGDGIQLEIPEAIEQLQEFSDDDKWLFVDGQSKNFSTLTQTDIQDASIISVTEQLQEG